MRFFVALVGVALSTVGMSQILNYTELTNSDTELALGYPVPIPVDSLTAVSGFRTYDSLFAHHQDLALQNIEVAAQIVGTTHLGRDIWAYVIGDPDDMTTNGQVEAAVLLNGGIHAREWASPEVVTELFEQLLEGKNDNGLVQFIVENVNTVLVPVNNVDGFIQTQTYPTQVTPTPPGVTINQPPVQFGQPRDGRMRRKNMLGVDQDLTTDADRLLGVDLNRNNLQFFENGSNSTDPTSLVYRGVAPASEPEIQALQQAATLAPENRLRFYADVHSFSRVYFIPSPLNTRQNNNTATLVNRLSASTGVDPNHPAYFPVFNAPNTGISGTAAFFAHTYLIPAWTLEIEPPSGFPGIPSAGAFYGGFGVSHDGFVLPDSEVARTRDELTRMHLLALYHQAGPPAAREVEIRNSAGNVVYAAQWQDNLDGTRTLMVTQNTPLIRDGSQYTLWLSFDKPMRFVNSAGVVTEFPGQNALGSLPSVRVNGSGVSVSVEFAAQPWVLTPGGAPSGYDRYMADALVGTFSFSTSLQISGPTSVSLGIVMNDIGGLATDGNPATVVDFQSGGWTGYENAAGVEGDFGGTDNSFVMELQLPAGVTPVTSSGGGGIPGILLLVCLFFGVSKYSSSTPAKTKLRQ